MPKSAASGPHMGNFVGPIWADQMGSMSIWPRAPCPPQMGSRRMSPLGLVWAPLGQPIMGCQHGPHLGSPDGLDVHLAAGSMSAPTGQPTNEPLGLSVSPTWTAHYGWPVWAPHGLDVNLAMGLHVSPSGQLSK